MSEYPIETVFTNVLRALVGNQRSVFYNANLFSVKSFYSVGLSVPCKSSFNVPSASNKICIARNPPQLR